MTASALQSLLSLMILTVMLYRLAIAIRTGRMRTARSRRIWQMYVMIAVLFAFWGESGEHGINQLLGPWPVALGFKSLAQLWIAQLYHLTMRDVQPRGYAPSWSFYLLPSAMVVGLGLFSVLQLRAQGLPPEPNLRYYILGYRDFFLGLYMFGYFLPATLRLIEKEQVAPMKLKLGATAGFFTTFGLASVVTVVCTGLYSMGQSRQWVDAHLESIVPFTYPLLLLTFLIMLAPHRWLAFLFSLPRLALLLRLRRLRRQVLALSGSTPIVVQAGEGFHLEMEIYRTVITILDHYPLLAHHPAATALFNRVHDAVAQDLRYPELVQVLAKVFR